MALFNPSILSIDIGSSAIKALEISGKATKRIRAIGIEPIAEGAVIDGVITDIPTTEKTLKHLLKRIGSLSKGKKIVISLSGGSVIVKRVMFPKSSTQDLSQTILYEAEQHFQHSIDDLNYDYYLLPTHENSPEVPVLLVGAKKDVVNQYLSIMRSLNLNVAAVDIDVLAIANMFEYNYGQIEGLIALVNLGAHSTQVTFLGHGQYLYTRDLSLGGFTYTSHIAHNLRMSLENAEGIKINGSNGTTPLTDDVKKLIHKVNLQIANEINMTIDYFFQTGIVPDRYNDIASIFTCGGSSRVFGLDQTLSQVLGIEVHKINPFQRMEGPPGMSQDQLSHLGSLYGVCVGLSLRKQQQGEQR